MRTGERIKKIRKNIGFTQKQLADKVHVSSQVISNWERGYSTPDSEDIKKISNALDCSIDFLLGKEETNRIYSNDDEEFDKWINDPEVYKFYKEFNESPEERRQALLAVWEILKNQKK